MPSNSQALTCGDRAAPARAKPPPRSAHPLLEPSLQLDQPVRRLGLRERLGQPYGSKHVRVPARRLSSCDPPRTRAQHQSARPRGTPSRPVPSLWAETDMRSIRVSPHGCSEATPPAHIDMKQGLARQSGSASSASAPHGEIVPTSLLTAHGGNQHQSGVSIRLESPQSRSRPGHRRGSVDLGAQQAATRQRDCPRRTVLRWPQQNAPSPPVANATSGNADYWLRWPPT